MSEHVPLILITNDDGIASPGLRAAIQAVHDLGDLLIVAPLRQFSGAGRAFLLIGDRSVQEQTILVNGQAFRAFGVDAPPAPTVRRGLLTLAPRKPDLAIAGINYGENVGVGITISGTVGAAIEAASYEIPSLAVSVQTAVSDHLSYSEEVEFSVAGHFTRLFARRLLSGGLPPGVDILKVDIPQGATLETPWQVTRVSRNRYFESIVVEGNPHKNVTGYDINFDIKDIEPDSDIWALVVDKVVAVAPLSIDLTAHIPAHELDQFLRGGVDA